MPGGNGWGRWGCRPRDGGGGGPFSAHLSLRLEHSSRPLTFLNPSPSQSPLRDRLLGPSSASALTRLETASVSIRVLPLLLAVAAIAAAVAAAAAARSRVFLLDFATYKGPADIQTSLDSFMYRTHKAGVFSPDAIDFQKRVSERNGVSDHAYLPPALHADPADRARRFPGATPTARTMAEAREEARMVLFTVVDDVLSRLALKPTDIDILVVNCSLFNPTPSLSAMLVNHFKMRSDIVTFNLAGMGCSAGVLATQLAGKCLATQRSSYALVVSTENITQNWYLGEDRSMLIPNTLFRMGGAAVVLTNKAVEVSESGEGRVEFLVERKTDEPPFFTHAKNPNPTHPHTLQRPRAKYELRHIVRVHLGADDVAHECVYQHEDAKGIVGVELNRDLVKVAGRALQKNMTKMGPLVLPVSEQVRFAFNYVARALLPPSSAPPPYTPDFKKAFDHFCLHAGGRGVIEGLSKQLALPAEKAAPSFNSLYWYGNTSSASLWYALGYIEAVQGVAAGDVVWQVGFGSGFKCNSAVWRALRRVKDSSHDAWQHMADPSNVAAVPAYLAAGGISQGTGAPKCAGTAIGEAPASPRLRARRVK